MRQCEKLW